MLGCAREHDRWTSDDASNDDADDETDVGSVTGVTDIARLAIADRDLEYLCTECW